MPTRITKYVLSKDRIKIAQDHYQSGFDRVIIFAHGFYNNKDAFLFKKMAQQFAESFDVIVLDFRGHGESEGLFSWTTKESQDLEAVIQYAKKNGYKKIGIIGFSLGAAVSLLQASHDQNIDSLIAVSAPYDFWKIDYHFWEQEMWEDLKLNMGPKGKGKGVRPGNPFEEKIRPIDVVSRISIPKLFIHGQKDWLINVKHSRKLFNKANEPKKIKIFEKAGHAEKIFDDYPNEFIEICLKWFQETIGQKEKCHENL